MDNFENIMEKYKKELMSFSRQSSPDLPDEQEKALSIPVVAMQPDVGNQETSIDSMTDNAPYTQSQRDAQIARDEQSNQPIRPTPDVYFVPKFDTYEDFENANPQTGALRVQAFAANQSFPIPNAKVSVYLELTDGQRLMFEGLTDISGVLDNIVLPAPELSLSQTPDSKGRLPYSSYTVTVERDGFTGARYVDVPVFSGIKSIQNAELVPLSSNGEPNGLNTVYEKEPFSNLNGGN